MVPSEEQNKKLGTRCNTPKENSSASTNKKNKNKKKWLRSLGKEYENRPSNKAHPQATEQEGEADASREQETKSNINHAYQLVGSRTIIIGTRLQDPVEEEENAKNRKNSARGRTAKKQSQKTTQYKMTWNMQTIPISSWNKMAMGKCVQD